VTLGIQLLKTLANHWEVRQTNWSFGKSWGFHLMEIKYNLVAVVLLVTNDLTLGEKENI
jgi:hypothetical protein